MSINHHWWIPRGRVTGIHFRTIVIDGLVMVLYNDTYYYAVGTKHGEKD